MIDELDTTISTAKGLEDYLCLRNWQVLDVGYSAMYFASVFWAMRQDLVNHVKLLDRDIANDSVENRIA